jgi:hypothetical protein
VEPTIIFTDASSRSWGVIRLERADMHVTSGPLGEMPIHEGEAIAVAEGLVDCKKNMHP